MKPGFILPPSAVITAVMREITEHSILNFFAGT
jgi:hypothetical protein